MTISFRRATPDDAEALVKVQIASFHSDALIYPGVPEDGPPGYDSLETALGKMAHEDYYTISDDEQIIGGLVVINQGEGHYHLDLIYIDPAYHNRGIGTQAMHFIEQTYAATKWTLDTPGYATRNHHFYEKLGYIKTKEQDYDGFLLLSYEKQI